MRGIEFYYQKFADIISKSDKDLSCTFNDYTKTHTPNYVYLWLEKKVKDGIISEEINNYMSDFYWEIR